MPLNKKSKKEIFPTIAAVLFWLLVWQTAAAVSGQTLLLSSPVWVARRLFALPAEKGAMAALGFTVSRILLGFAVGFVGGALLSVLAARVRAVEILLRPLMVMVRSVPVASFIILALIWLSGKKLSAFIAFLMVLPIVYGHLLTGMKAADGKLTEMARVYHVPFGRRLRWMLLPGIKPYLMNALTLSVGMSFKAGAAAEVIGIPAGSVGEKLYQAKVYLDLTDLYAWTVLLVLSGVVIEKLLTRLLGMALERSCR